MGLSLSTDKAPLQRAGRSRLANDVRVFAELSIRWIKRDSRNGRGLVIIILFLFATSIFAELFPKGVVSVLQMVSPAFALRAPVVSAAVKVTSEALSSFRRH